MARRRPETKVEVPIGKPEWHPSPLLGQIVLVSSKNSRGEIHAARKSWVTMVASVPPMIGLCCRLSHRTAINILETREFVINIPGEDLIARVWNAGDSVETAVDPAASEWSFIPSTRLSVPRVEECKGHIECALDSTKRFNDDEMIFFGRILAVAMDESILEGPVEERYRALRALLFLEPGLYGVADTARKAPA